MNIVLAGNPNCGKTVLFNLLTGSRQRVGNWSGVTVDRKHGTCKIAGQHIQVTDLPGIYSLHTNRDMEHSVDERIACEHLLSGDVDLIINVIDASNLERHLYLTAQLLEMQIPMIIALNMTDTAKRRGLEIDTDQLQAKLNCPVISLVANRRRGLHALRHQLTQAIAPPDVDYHFPACIDHALNQLTVNYHTPNSHWLALRLLESDDFAEHQADKSQLALALSLRDEIKQNQGEPADMLIAQARYEWTHDIAQSCVSKVKLLRHTTTELIDRIVLNRFIGIPFFLFVMYVTFFFAINIGGAFQDFFDLSSTALFIDGFTQLLHTIDSPAWLTAILANGLGKGINTVVTFIPIIGSLFLFLSLLEDSGYMARAAFVIDRVMQAIGLPGKAFVPLIVGFGCNVPTIMATRTLSSRRDRILTTMMAPFMSCGARLAIYAVFVGAFFQHGGQNVIFILYLSGIAIAVLTGLALRFTVLKGVSTAMPTEFPTYHLPHVSSILRSTWHRLRLFLKKAGRFIIPICMLIGALNAVSIDGKLLHGEANQESVLSSIGRTITPVFKPMGIETDNWPATVGLFTGLLAKEVVVGTLNTLYSQVGHLHQERELNHVSQGLRDALHSIPTNLAALPDALRNPIAASAPMQDVNQGVFGVMHRYFDGTAGAFAYLLFILLYFPCVSTMAVMRREIGSQWANFSMVWTTGVAYGVATMYFQIATWHRHPMSTTAWVSSILAVFIATLIVLRRQTQRRDH